MAYQNVLVTDAPPKAEILSTTLPIQYAAYKNIFSIPLEKIATPCFILDEASLERNAMLLSEIKKRTGCKILLALKAFSTFRSFPLLRRYLDGITASSINEARLGAEEFGKEIHVYAPAYTEKDFDSLLHYADHITFNSFSQWKRFREKVKTKKKDVHCAIRINPQHSEVKISLYDPSSRFSRLGVTLPEFEPDQIKGMSGFHFHNLCGSGFDSLKRTLKSVEEKFGSYFMRPSISWINFGGGHLVTKEGYDLDEICELISNFQNRYHVQVILEPGEAVVYQTGVLVASVVDIIRNDMDIAILDTSASAHMPDILEMPYRPEIEGAEQPFIYPYTYRLGGLTCLSGDVIGDFSFESPLKIGQKLIFKDMAQYTMVKTTLFNGLNLPSIGYLTKQREFELIREFDYMDFKNRLS